MSHSTVVRVYFELWRGPSSRAGFPSICMQALSPKPRTMFPFRVVGIVRVRFGWDCDVLRVNQWQVVGGDGRVRFENSFFFASAVMGSFFSNFWIFCSCPRYSNWLKKYFVVWCICFTDVCKLTNFQGSLHHRTSHSKYERIFFFYMLMSCTGSRMSCESPGSGIVTLNFVSPAGAPTRWIVMWNALHARSKSWWEFARHARRLGKLFYL